MDPALGLLLPPPAPGARVLALCDGCGAGRAADGGVAPGHQRVARQAVGDRDQAARELPASAWLDLARQGVDAGMVFLLLTGGEVGGGEGYMDGLWSSPDLVGLISLAVATVWGMLLYPVFMGQRDPVLQWLLLFLAAVVVLAVTRNEKAHAGLTLAAWALFLTWVISFGLQQVIDGYGRPSFRAIHRAVDRFGGSFAAAAR